jgi:hypothetical protein
MEYFPGACWGNTAVLISVPAKSLHGSMLSNVERMGVDNAGQRENNPPFPFKKWIGGLFLPQ